ncbi:hypothetical protein DDB_G0271080 [Dictyostelium discoideum AX4]|uniref:Uncharacterized protein n=1 Tax=Dictyostelium discoideum TaxID=44689 RepID=Q55BR4_DICDI|nr:hypothetical protein DDB_G0271080 [Dictyostelium discoideum AX4]EAL72890.1 hypothetical protein DDB_G0271080 [Dictyostelium discoideum AX4]|eukprot:XP_646767.1 hypothetical protein DDB_G0271080 [Dictyostelium discoideum AX4]
MNYSSGSNNLSKILNKFQEISKSENDEEYKFSISEVIRVTGLLLFSPKDESLSQELKQIKTELRPDHQKELETLLCQ